MKEELEQFVICEHCLAHYSPLITHTCPQWLAKLVEQKKIRDEAKDVVDDMFNTAFGR